MSADLAWEPPDLEWDDNDEQNASLDLAPPPDAWDDDEYVYLIGAQLAQGHLLAVWDTEQHRVRLRAVTNVPTEGGLL